MGHPRWPMSSYPKSWFVAAYSDDLGHKQVQPLKFFGQNLVMYRTEKGEAVLLDAYCAHMGTHLGMGGVVAGDAIRCPLHGWQFNESGDCMQVPYAEGVPRNASIRGLSMGDLITSADRP